MRYLTIFQIWVQRSPATSNSPNRLQMTDTAQLAFNTMDKTAKRQSARAEKFPNEISSGLPESQARVNTSRVIC